MADHMVERHLLMRGCRSVCIREVQKSLKESAKRLLEDKIEAMGLTERDGFKVFREVIETPGDGIISFTGMQDHTADSVKSLEGYHTAWVEEAQSLSERSLTLLRPTIRADGSELWFSWNPHRPTDAIERFLRSAVTPKDAIVIKANWRDNPWFPDKLERDRVHCLAHEADRYGHIWEGEYATVLDGAYFAEALTRCQLDGRIGVLARDPLLPVYAFFDLGSSSRKADATAIWIVQFVGHQVRVLDYYEATGQEFAVHVDWLKRQGYGEANCVLPHDGARHDVVHAVTPEGFLRKAGFSVETIPNQGQGAANRRIDAVRDMFPNVWFQEDKTQGGREALGWYHERKDEARNIGLGPNHDWSSHGADAFGLCAIYYASRRTSDDRWGKKLHRNAGSIA